MNLPDYNFLPAPLWLITTLHVVTLTLHFVAMNFLFGGLIVVLFGRLDGKWQNPSVRRYVALLPTAMAATVTLGVAPLLFLQLTYHGPAYAASIVSGWLWLFITVVVMVAYYFLYGAAFAAPARAGRVPVLLALSAIALAYVSFVYSSVFSMAERPDLYHALYAADQSGRVVNSDLRDWVPRWLHMLSGAVTVGAFCVGLLGKDDERVFKLGRNWFVGGMAAAIVLGFVYLFALGDLLLPMMRSPAMWLILVSLVLSLGSLHFYFKRKFIGAGLMLFVSLLAMVVVRHILRVIVIGDAWNPATIPIKPQWSVFVIFLVCFVIAIALVWWMLKMFFGDRARGQAS